uniref:Uncharacterized protein n=1 Tax=Arundo donax TaxID=35708 RepID=A0A0A8YQQ3_ARUDO
MEPMLYYGVEGVAVGARTARWPLSFLYERFLTEQIMLGCMDNQVCMMIHP